HADERRLYRGERGVQLGGRDRKARRLELGRHELGERRAACYVVLPQLALRLVDRHRGPPPEVGPRERGIYLTLVQRMPVLVQRAEQRLNVAVAVARRDARVATIEPGRERVWRDVHSPAVLI